MAYPRRLSGTRLAPPSPRRTGGSASEDDVDVDSDSPVVSSALTPPRPFFFAADTTTTNRSSSSSLDNTSLDPASDSDADPPAPAHVAAPTSAHIRPRSIGPHAHGHRMHTRKRSSMSTSTSNAVLYTALDTSPPLASPPLASPPAPLASPSPPPPPTAITSTSNPPVPDSPTTTTSSHQAQPQTQYTKPLPHRPPPSSFAFPFQAYPGNPDPGLNIPGMSRRRSSFESIPPGDAGNANAGPYNAYGNYTAYGNNSGNGNDNALSMPRSGSLSDLRKPFAPFMADSAGLSGSETGSSSSLPRNSSSNSLYKQSAAAAVAVSPPSTSANATAGQGGLPRNSSVHSFRAPFLAPSSRPTSSLWSPPSYTQQYITTSSSPTPLNPLPTSPTASTTALALALGQPPSSYPPPAPLLSSTKPPLPSTRLRHPLPASSKPWLTHPPAAHRTRARLSYTITLALVLLGAIAAALLCFTGVTSVDAGIPLANLCPVLDEEFSAGALDTNTWNVESELSGFGNGQFEMTTAAAANLYIQDGELYMMPTLTSDTVQGVLDGGSFTLEGCTAGVEGVASWDSGGTGNKANGGMGGGGGGGGASSSSASQSASASASGSASASASGSRSASGAAASATGTGTGTGNNGNTNTGNGNTATTGNNNNANTNTGNNNFAVLASNSTSSNSSSSTQNAPNANGACSVSSNAALGTVINPVQSARINTLGKKSIKYGKVEVRAKLPRGDWLWPALFLLPAPPSPYGAWPVSGEIDLMEARGNAPTYPAQGSNFIRSSLNFGPFPSLGSSGGGGSASATLLHTVFGWFGLKRGGFDTGFHVYTFEWTEAFMRFSIDKRTHTVLQTSTRARTPSFSLAALRPSLSSSSALSSPKNSYFAQAHFPATAHNTSAGSAADIVAVTDPYLGVADSTPSAPFDREFFLVVDLAVGGTSGWFPDGVGGKMWFDGSATAMRDFARAQDTWYATWPQDASDRAFRIDYVKMWELCK